eukprot:6548804-Pyramimonas_sp.AAC.1
MHSRSMLSSRKQKVSEVFANEWRQELKAQAAKETEKTHRMKVEATSRFARRHRIHDGKIRRHNGAKWTIDN